MIRIRPLIFAIAAVVTAAAANPAAAQVKPFKVSGSGVVDYVPVQPGDAVRHWAIGHATELGRYYGEGKVQLVNIAEAQAELYRSLNEPQDLALRRR